MYPEDTRLCIQGAFAYALPFYSLYKTYEVNKLRDIRIAPYFVLSRFYIHSEIAYRLFSSCMFGPQGYIFMSASSHKCNFSSLYHSNYLFAFQALYWFWNSARTSWYPASSRAAWYFSIVDSTSAAGIPPFSRGNP